MAVRARKSSRETSESAERAREHRILLGQWLKDRREAAELTQADLGIELGLKYYSFISQVENGIGRIPQELYAPWADALNVDQKTFAWTALSHLEPGLYDMLSKSKDRAL